MSTITRMVWTSPASETTSPIVVIQRSGVLENEVIASQASRIDFQTGYLVTPAWRGARS